MFARRKLLIALSTSIVFAVACGEEPLGEDAWDQQDKADTASIEAGTTFTALKDITLDDETQLRLSMHNVGQCTVDVSGREDPQVLEGDSFVVVSVRLLREHHYDWPEGASMASDFYTSDTEIIMEDGLVITCNGIKGFNTGYYIDYRHYWMNKKEIRILLEDYFEVSK